MEKREEKKNNEAAFTFCKRATVTERLIISTIVYGGPQNNGEITQHGIVFGVFRVH